MTCQKYNLDFDDLVREDLDGIYKYLYWVSQDKNVAGSFVARIENAINNIAFFPRTYPRMLNDGLYEEGYRKLVFANYIVPFTIDEETKTVNIMRVLHGRMDYQRFL